MVQWKMMENGFLEDVFSPKRARLPLPVIGREKKVDYPLICGMTLIISWGRRSGIGRGPSNSQSCQLTSSWSLNLEVFICWEMEEH